MESTSETNKTGASPTTTPRTPDLTSNEDMTSDHAYAENESVSNNSIDQNVNLLINTAADAAVHGARDSYVALQQSFLFF